MKSKQLLKPVQPGQRHLQQRRLQPQPLLLKPDRGKTKALVSSQFAWELRKRPGYRTTSLFIPKEIKTGKEKAKDGTIVSPTFVSS